VEPSKQYNLPNAVGPVPSVLDLCITQTATGVVLTLVLMGIYVILMIWILMRLLLTRSESIDLTPTITLLTLYHLCLLLLVRLGGYIVNLSDVYSYRCRYFIHVECP
jgi:hypothetical protein